MASLGRRRARAGGGDRLDRSRMHGGQRLLIKRRARTTEPWKTLVYHRYPKLGVVCDTSDHFILGLSGRSRTAPRRGRVSIADRRRPTARRLSLVVATLATTRKQP